MKIPRILISAPSGGSGKTLLSLGLCRAFSNAGKVVKPYKKGPDYIDARWLQLASRNACTNLDPYFLDADRLLSLFVHSQRIDDNALCIIEGNRGLFDGHDVLGSCSSAELARVLSAPVIISLNITKMTRTAAAVLAGLASFEKDLNIAGVVLNEVGSARHEDVVAKAITHYTDVPVLGALPRLKSNPLPERHMGLSDASDVRSDETLDELAEFISENCDLGRIFDIANAACAIDEPKPFWSDKFESGASVRIGYVYDEAFWFYYEENFEALRRAGAELVPLSLLNSAEWPPDLGGLYIGGGYPEEYLEILSKSEHLKRLKQYSDEFMPIYAECGGFMVLASDIVREDVHYPMAGVFAVKAEFHSRPQGLGYVQAEVKGKNPYHPPQARLRGHEFHYSRCLPSIEKNELDSMLCFGLEKGVGMGQSMDGLCINNTFASYTHIYAPNCPWWAENFVKLAKDWQKNNKAEG